MCVSQEVNQPFSELGSGVFYWKTQPVCFGCVATHPQGSCSQVGCSVLEVLWQMLELQWMRLVPKSFTLGCLTFFFFFPDEKLKFPLQDET